MIALKALHPLIIYSKQLKPTGRRIHAIMIVCRNYRLSTSLTPESRSRKVVKLSELAQFLSLEDQMMRSVFSKVYAGICPKTFCSFSLCGKEITRELVGIICS